MANGRMIIKCPIDEEMAPELFKILSSLSNPRHRTQKLWMLAQAQASAVKTEIKPSLTNVIKESEVKATAPQLNMDFTNTDSDDLGDLLGNQTYAIPAAN